MNVGKKMNVGIPKFIYNIYYIHPYDTQLKVINIGKLSLSALCSCVVSSVSQEN